MNEHLQTRTRRVTILAVAAAMLGSIFAPLATTPAHAGSKGRRNTTIGLGAITAYGLLKRKKKLAIIGGIGTGVAYYRYRQARKSEKRRDAYNRARARRYGYSNYRNNRRSSRYRTNRYRYAR